MLVRIVPHGEPRQSTEQAVTWKRITLVQISMRPSERRTESNRECAQAYCSFPSHKFIIYKRLVLRDLSPFTYVSQWNEY